MVMPRHPDCDQNQMSSDILRSSVLILFCPDSFVAQSLMLPWVLANFVLLLLYQLGPEDHRVCTYPFIGF
jgi:hypothetical protein